MVNLYSYRSRTRSELSNNFSRMNKIKRNEQNKTKIGEEWEKNERKKKKSNNYEWSGDNLIITVKTFFLSLHRSLFFILLCVFFFFLLPLSLSSSPVCLAHSIYTHTNIFFKSFHVVLAILSLSYSVFVCVGCFIFRFSLVFFGAKTRYTPQGWE